MSEFSASLSEWFSERPQWLQFAAKRLLEQDNITDKDISEFVGLCKQEAENTLTETDCTFPINAFAAKQIGTLKLCSISKIEGINALAPRKPLEIGKSNLTIVYGNNGSGKSGYVRLLKHICGARHLGILHPNVYTKIPNTQKATIEFEKNGEMISHEWIGNGCFDELRSVDIFDTSFGRVFVNNEDEVGYEPPVLSFFSLLISICEKVAGKLDTEVTRHPSKKPNFPSELKATQEGLWFEAISNKNTLADVKQNCCFTKEDIKKLQPLQQRLAEQAPSEKGKSLRTQKAHIDSLIQDAEKHLNQLSDENCHRIIAAKRTAILKKNVADTAAEHAFSGSQLEGIGSDIWKELWAAARNYSTTKAYRNQEFPYTANNARCVLCHQHLSPEAATRLLSFEEFIKRELLKEAVLAAKNYNSAFQALEDIPTENAIKIRIDAAGLQKGELIAELNNFFSGLKKRKDSLQSAESGESLHPIPQKTEWFDEAKKTSARLDEEAKNYDQDAQNDNRDKLKKSVNSFLARKWLFEHREQIEQEIERQKQLDLIHKAEKMCNTKALSLKKGELAEALITDAFVKRFNAELKNLGASQVRVELVKSKVSKGRVLHRLQLRGATNSSLNDVLSEGESRIVSIAAFLADSTGQNNNAPFIFDDPISSLDQNYEEAVVRRLIELSSNRQVIVFTHRLSLLGTIKHLAEKKAQVVSIRSAEWGTGEPAPIPLSQSDIKSALNILINQAYPEAKKASEAGEFRTEEILIKSICSDFRSLLERAIENDLLCGIVQRYHRPVYTLKLKNLSKLRDSDCEKLDSLMTKYSYFEHSHPSESQIELPKLDELLTDLTALKDWREEYSKRVS